MSGLDTPTRRSHAGFGSGTTAVASKQLGRKFVGCDIEESEVATMTARLYA
jgi:DNA modification methylase